MKTSTIASRLLSTAIAAGTVLASGSALAHTVPDRLFMDDISVPSWTESIGGEWTALTDSGISTTKCWKKDSGPVDQVLLQAANYYYVFQASDCNVGAGVPMLPLASGASPDPTFASFIHSIREVTIEVTADDGYTVFVDGNEELDVYDCGFCNSEIITLDLIGGQHTVEVEVRDVHGTVAGMAASVDIEGSSDPMLLTGVASWIVTMINGVAANQLAQLAPHGYHDPAGDLSDDGAQYVWWSDATALGTATLELDFVVP